jgi:hypothetical protein
MTPLMVANPQDSSPSRDLSNNSSRFSLPVLIVVEGAHDVEFLKRLTVRLHLEETSIPDLSAGEHAGRVIFIPFGGGRVLAWSDRFAPLACREFHLYDREIEPETALRQESVDRINGRPNHRELLLGKRSLENDLHPAAIVNAGGGQIVGTDHEPLATSVARDWYLRQPQPLPWNELPPRARQRHVARSKRWLNRQAIEAMTLDMLARSDSTGELLSWLREIGTAIDHP